MKKLEGTRLVRASARYFTVPLDGRAAPLQLKLPNHARMSELLGFTASFLAEYNAENPDDHTAMYRLMSRRLRLEAAYVGLCWFDLRQVLETPRPACGADLFTYGDDVLDELEEGGVDGDATSAVYEVCRDRIQAAVFGPSDAEVEKEAADFTAPA